MGYFHHRFVLETIVHEERQVALHIYDNTFKQLNEKYELLAQSIISDEQIIKAFERGDRQRLLSLTAPIYNDLLAENPYLSIMHFHTKETRSFLRLHKPLKYADELGGIRHMIGSVNASKNRLSGIEVGRCGVHYRLALPVFNAQGRHLGAFEFGISIDYLFDLFSREYGFTPLLLLKKESFARMEEKKGLNYTLFGEGYYLVTPSKDPLFDLLDTEVLDEKYTLLSNAGRDNLVFGVTDLRNSIGEDLGKILFVKNLNFYTDKIAFVERVTFGLAALILLFSFFLLRKTFTSYIVMIDRYKSVLEIKNRSLLRLAHTDHLTKISNRKSIEKLLKEELKRANRYRRPLSLIMLDVDDFKKINDTFGYSAGDKVLRQLSRIVSSAIRDTDHFGRWGGEEFIIVTTETPLENALQLGEKIRALLSTADFDGDQKVSCSIGVAPYHHGDDYDRLLSHADIAMYAAKNSGKDRVLSYSDI